MRRRWAVVLTGGEDHHGRHAGAPLTPAIDEAVSFSGLLDGLDLVEETSCPAVEDGDDVRTLLLLDPKRHPASRSAAAGMALALGRIRRTDRDGVVGFFPSLSHLAHVGKFRGAVSLAYQLAARHPGRLIVAGAAPRGAESDREAYVINGFGRYPQAAWASEQFARRCLWNVSITVGTVDAFRASFLGAQPSLAVLVDAIASARSSADESQAVEAAFSRLPRLRFSTALPATSRQGCLVVPLVAAP